MIIALLPINESLLIESTFFDIIVVMKVGKKITKRVIMKKVLFIVFILFYSSFGNAIAYWGWDYNFNVACDENGDGGGKCIQDIGTYQFDTRRGYGADYVLLIYC